MSTFHAERIFFSVPLAHISTYGPAPESLSGIVTIIPDHYSRMTLPALPTSAWVLSISYQ